MSKGNKELIDVLRRYFPERVFEMIEKDPASFRIEGERRTVTVLFGDLSGFTELTERLQDPEEIVVIINRYFSRMLEIVDKYGGDLDKLIGDAIMVLFGAPVAHKDDPVRAVGAALEMISAIRELGSIDLPEGEVEINMSIGINTGEVVALNMGSDKRMEYTVMGDAVNLASRLEGVAQPGEVIISDVTYEEVKDEIECKGLKPVRVKGKEKPIQIYRAFQKREKKIESMLQFPFVDREDEMEYLSNVVEEVKRGGSDRLSLFGWFGSGKTRLCKELIESIEGVRVIHLKGREFGPNIPYYVIREWIEEEYGENLPYNLGFFLSEPEEGIDFKTTVEEGWDEYIKEILNISPLLLWIEDWEYIDSLTHDLFTRSVDKERFLIIAESEEPVSGFEKIEMEALKEESIRELAEYAFQDAISEHLLKFLLERSEGNPYSLQLIVEWLSQNNLYEKIGSRMELKEDINEIAFPKGLNAFMAEKLDSYPDALRTFVKNASVFGDRFNLDDYLHIFRTKEKYIKEISGDAVDKGILKSKGREFYFISSPLRKVAYDSIFKQKRNELHKEIASLLEKRFPDRLKEWASVLAFHYQSAGDLERSVEYFLMAADQEKRYSDYTSALSHYKEAEGFCQELEDKEGLIYSLEGIGVTYYRMGRFDRAREEIEKAIKIAEEEHSERIAQLYGTLALILRDSGEYDEAASYYEKAIPLFEETGDKKMLSAIYQNLAGLYLSRSNYEEALSLYEKSLDLAIQSDRLNISADIRFSMGHIYDILGKRDLSEQSYKEALEIEKHLKDRDGQARILLNLGGLFINTGKLKEAEESLKESLKVSEEVGNVEYRGRANLNLGILHSSRGELEKSLSRYQEALEDFREIHSISQVNTALANIAEIYELRAELDSSEDNYNKALKGAEELSDLYTEAYIRIKLGRIRLWRGDFPGACEQFNRALDIARKIEVPDLKFDALQFLARLNLRIGFVDRAEKVLTEVNPELIANYEIKGRHLITSALIEEAKGNKGEALRICRKLIDLGNKTGSPGIILDGYGTLLRLGILSDEEMDDIIRGSGEIIDENVFIVRNLWIILSLVEYYLEIGEIDRAALSVDYALTSSSEHNLRLINLDANILSARISEARGEKNVPDRYEEAIDILVSIGKPLNKEQKLRYYKTHTSILDALLRIYYIRKNRPLILELLRKLPKPIRKGLIKERRKQDPSLTEEIIAELKTM